MTSTEYRALMVRSQGLNKKYGLGKWSTASTNRVTTVATNGFSWGAFGIGAAAALGLVLLTGCRHGEVARRILGDRRPPPKPVHVPPGPVGRR